MKRLAFWLILGVVVMGLAGRRHRAAHARFEDSRRSEVRITTVTTWDDDDRPEPPTPPPAPKRVSGRVRVVRQVPSTPPAPPASAGPWRGTG